MKQLFMYLSFVAIILLLACNDDKDCIGIECSSEPEAFNFGFVDKNMGENLITNGTISIDDISVNITTTADTSYVIYRIASTSKFSDHFVVYGIGDQTEQVNCVIKICGEEVLHLYVDAERRSENCCSWTHFNEISIETEYEFNEGKHNIYTVYMDSFCQ